MKLLHKVVKSSKINLTSDTVGIENTVILPPKVEEMHEHDEVVEEVIDYEGIAREKADAILKAAEEELRKANEQAGRMIKSADGQAEQIN